MYLQGCDQGYSTSRLHFRNSVSFHVFDSFFSMLDELFNAIIPVNKATLEFIRRKKSQKLLTWLQLVIPRSHDGSRAKESHHRHGGN